MVRLLADRGLPMVPQGGNTSLCGAATPDVSGRAVVLSLARMNRIRALEPADNLMVVESGCVLSNVQDAAASVGRLFPLSLAAEGTCQIGGVIGTNAGGTAVLRYGMTRDLVMGIEAVLPSGELFSDLRGLRKNNTGYDLKQLFVGAEGTLGVVTAAALKLFPQPRETVTAWVAVPDAAAAVGLLRHLQQDAGDQVTTFELVSTEALGLVLSLIPGSVAPLDPASPFHVLLEVASYWRGFAARDAVVDSLSRAADVGLVLDATVADSEDKAQALWRLREQVPEAERKSGYAVKHDISVRPGQIPAFLAATRTAVETAFPGARIIMFGHLGDGSLHYNVVLPGQDRQPIPAPLRNQVWRVVHDVVDGFGGSISAEHGIGQLKRDELQRYQSPVALGLMRTIKRALDPQAVMNPGKIVDAAAPVP